MAAVRPPVQAAEPAWRRAGRAQIPLSQRIDKALSRFASAPGPGGKTREALAMAGRLSRRLLARLGFPVATGQGRGSAAMAPLRVRQLYPAPTAQPSVTAMGGGVVLISCGEHPPGAVSVEFIDRHGTLYPPRVLETRLGRLPRTKPGADDVREAADSAEQKIGPAQLVLQVPPELFENGRAALDVRLSTPDGEKVYADMQFENISGIVIESFRLVHGRMLVSGSVTRKALQTIGLGLFVDGILSRAGKVTLGGHRFSSHIEFDRKHLDGDAHIVELRELPDLALLASTYEILPSHVTPWDALQTYARAPLSPALAPEASHHYRAYRLWVENLAKDRALPPLPQLHAELLQGPTKRQTYPALDFPPEENPAVSIVIPAHNKFEVTYYCLCALLFAYNETRYEVILVDDGSNDETRDIAGIVRGIEVLRNDTAQGFVMSCNRGAAAARGEFIVLLNNDTQPTALWLDELVAVFRNFDDIGLAGSKLIYPDGKLQEAGGILWASGNPWNAGRGTNAQDPRFNYLRQVDYVSGAALMVRSDVWRDVGGLSEEFAPAYFEDTDLAMKVQARGHRVVYVPASEVYHYEGQSAGTDPRTGMKRYQEINRPKFKSKWSAEFETHGREGKQPDREKDRKAALRVLFVDNGFPTVDMDAGSYAAFQEIRLFQSLGAKITFLPRNLAWLDRHTLALQRIGVECLYAPFVTDFIAYIERHAAEYDAIFVTRFALAEQVIALVRNAAPATKIVFNLADLHFLREMREAESGTAGYTRERALHTRNRELAVVKASDLTLSYSDVELALLERELAGVRTARMPWIVDVKARRTGFAQTDGIVFLGGFGHPPNVSAVRFFANEVMPAIVKRLPDAVFEVVGSRAERMLAEFDLPHTRIRGYVADLDGVLSRARVFVAPLLAGAGIKGKVLETLAAGVPSVLSPVAAEGIGVSDGVHCLIAQSPEEWAEQTIRLYTDESLWSKLASEAQTLAATAFSFDRGQALLREALAKIDVHGRPEWGLRYKAARPIRYGR